MRPTLWIICPLWAPSREPRCSVSPRCSKYTAQKKLVGLRCVSVSRLGSCRSRPPRRLCRRKLALEKDLLQRTRTLINPTSSVSKCLETQMNNNENISKCSCFCQQDVFSSRKFGTGLFSWRRGEKNPSAASLLRTSV